MNNKLLSRSIHAISHPFCMLAVFVLLVNDHLLRQVWPSWWTGKLGDVAWLFFAPVLLLLLLSMVFRPQDQVKVKRIIALSYGAVGLVFTLVNVSAGLTGILISCGESLLRIPLQLTADPTDLLTLPGLLLSLVFFARQKPVKYEMPYRGVLLAACGGLLTLANMAAPQFGVDDLEVRAGHVIACSAYEIHISNDGGLTWELDDLDFSPACQGDSRDDLFFDINNEKQYRYFADAKVIESSIDGGTTWITEFVIQPASQAKQALQEKNQPGNPISVQGPLDGVYEPESGNLIFAMGLEGVLVRTAEGEWKEVAVGDFKPIQRMTFSHAVILLWGELLAGLGLFLLLFSSTSIHLKPRVFSWIWLVCGWLGWLGAVLVFQPALNDGYPIPLDLIFTALGLLIVPLSAYFIYLVIKRYRMKIIPIRLVNFTVSLLFLLPYFLWAYNIIPQYQYAMLMGLAAAGLGTMISINVMRRIDAQVI